MIETYKILNWKYDEDVSSFLCLHRDHVPNPTLVRGHSKKLFKPKFKTKLRKHSFGHRVVDTWNSLPEKIVSAPSINSFERRLDKFWKNQDLKFDYKKALQIYHKNNSPFEEAGSDEELPI